MGSLSPLRSLINAEEAEFNNPIASSHMWTIQVAILTTLQISIKATKVCKDWYQMLTNNKEGLTKIWMEQKT